MDTGWKEGKDPRFTPVGRMLRALRIENLPSAWNVLWGDMSMVGNPAPSLPEFIEYSAFHRKKSIGKARNHRLLAGIQQGTQAAYRGGAKRVRPGIYTELDGGP